MNSNQLLLQYAQANLQLDGIYQVKVPAGSMALGQTTMDGACGFVFPVQGSAKFTLSESEYHLEYGTILHAGSRMEINKEALGTGEWEYILLHYKVLDEDKTNSSLLTTHYTLKVFSDRYREILELLEKLTNEYRQPGRKSLLSTKAILYEIISKLLAYSEERSDYQPKDSLEKILEYIHKNLHKNLLVTGLAEEFGLNPKQFYYQFHKKLGISPKKYIVETQIKRAKELLIEEDSSISDISLMVGYEDSLHFSRIFKQNVGLSPKSFRSQFGKNPY